MCSKCCLSESLKFFEGVKVCFCERTNGNFNASVTTLLAARTVVNISSGQTV